MNIKFEIVSELEEKIKFYYDKKDYDKAVKEGLKVLNQMLKREFLLHLDNLELIDELLEYGHPYVQLENFYADLDEYTIRGMLLFLKGLYMKMEDKELHEYRKEIYSKADANIILSFINYFLGLIDIRNREFDIEEVLHIICNSKRTNYVEYIPDIPFTIKKDERLKSAMIVIEKYYEDGYEELIDLFWQIVYGLEEDEMKEILKYFNDLFSKVDSIKDMIYYLDAFNDSFFHLLDKDSKEKIEDYMFKDFSKGEYEEKDKWFSGHGLYTLTKIRSYLPFFNREKWTEELVKKLSRIDKLDINNPLLKYFDIMADYSHNNPTERILLEYIEVKLSENNEFMMWYFNTHIFYSYSQHSWSKIFRKYNKKETQ